MNFENLVGKTLVKIEDGEVGSETLFLTDNGGNCYCSQHMQSCSESVSIHSVEGQYSDILGSPIICAFEEYPDLPPPPNPDSYTWTQQTIVTDNGRVSWLWLGESNGYYGESPYFSISHPSL